MQWRTARGINQLSNYSICLHVYCHILSLRAFAANVLDLKSENVPPEILWAHVCACILTNEIRSNVVASVVFLRCLI